MSARHFVLDHLAIGVAEVGDVVPFLVGVLGGTPREAGPGAGFLWWQWSFAGGGALEVIVPDGPPDGFVHRFLAARGPGAHHVTFKVPDIHAAMKRATDAGYEVVGFDERISSWKEAFLHPKQAQGIVVQIVESQYGEGGDADYEALASTWVHPPAPPDPPPAARLVGLRLSAHSEERARRQWETVLAGACKHANGDLVFTWPDSPLRLTVAIDPEASEGPVRAEVSAPRPLALPEGPHPVLGLPFVQLPEEPT